MTLAGSGAHRESRARWIAIAVAWIAVVAILLVWLLGTAPLLLREQLKTLQFWSLETCAALGVAITLMVLRDLASELRWIDAAAMTAVVLVGLGLTLGMAPRTNRIFYDEQIYQNVGQNLTDLRQAQLCNDGAIEQRRLRCFKGEYNKQPYAYPHVLSVAYRLFGVSEQVAFGVNAAAMALTTAAIYLLVVILFADRTAAFFAAFMFALNPEQLLWSATAAAEASASLACVAALVAAGCFLRWRSTAALIGTAVAAAYAMQFRLESALLVPVILLLLWTRAREEFSQPRLWWAGLLCLTLTAVHVGHLVAVRSEGWGTTEARFSFRYLPINLRDNGWFYVADPRFPATYTLFALIGVTGRRAEPGRLAIALYLALFLGITLVFYAGSYNFGADVRYALTTFPPLMILSGLGAARVVRGLERIRVGRLATPIVGAALALQFAWYVPVVHAIDDSAWAARADVEFARSFVSNLQRNSYVLTHNPGMFQVWGVNAGQMSLAATNPAWLQELTARYSGGVYLHWNFWCNVQDPIQVGFCTKVRGLAPFQPVREHAERDQHYRFYVLEKPGR